MNSESEFDESRLPDEEVIIPKVQEAKRPTDDPERQAEPEFRLPPNVTPRRSVRERRPSERWRYTVT